MAEELGRRGVVIVGGGFVGLHEAVLFALRGYRVLIHDIDRRVVDAVNSGDTDELHIRERYILENWGRVKERMIADTSPSIIGEGGVIVVAVNTPLKVYGEDLVTKLDTVERIDELIDFEPLIDSVNKVARYASAPIYVNSLVTIFPGGTKRFIVDELVGAGFRLGADLFVTHTPERLDPGSRYSPEQIPRNLGYLDEASLRVGREIYGKMGVKLTPAPLSLVELSKLHENAFRLLNIAFVQESFFNYGDDFLEVVDLAGSKPFGFMKFYPSPYAGGTCLVKDSVMYWYATRNQLIKQALIINERAPRRYAEILAEKLRKRGFRRVVFRGLGFKPGSVYYISKWLNPIERLVEELRRVAPEIEVRRFDPNMPHISDFQSEEEAREWADIVIHWDYKSLVKLGLE